MIYAARGFFPAIGAVISLSCVAPVASDGRMAPVAAVTVCDLTTRPASFDGKLVTVSATVKPAAHYTIVVTDPRCGDQTIALLIPSKLDGDADVEELRNSVLAGYPRAPNRRVRARLTGEFHSRPSEVPSRLLLLHRVANVKTESE